MALAGELDERVAIQARSRTPDGAGGYSEAWSTVATVWARVRPLSGRERLLGEQLEAPRNYRVTIRRRAVTADHRLLWRGVALNVRFAPLVGSRELYQDLDCEMGVAD